MRRFRDLPIRRKVTLLILGASGIALGLAAAGVAVYDATTTQPRILRDLTAQADIIRVTTTAALLFGDTDAATENLATLRAKPEISAAAIYERDDQLFASYLRPPLKTLPFATRPPAGSRFESKHLTLVQPFTADEEIEGWLVLRYDLPALAERLSQYGPLAGVLLLALLTVALQVHRFLRVSISTPLLGLAKASDAVSRQEHGIRVTKHGDDEIGRLTDAFNHMLQTLQEREAALQESAQQLRDAMVAARMSSWSLDVGQKTLSWGGQEARLFGPDGSPSDASFASFLEMVHPGDRASVTDELQRAATGDRSVDIDFRLVAPQGRLRWLAMRGHVTRDQDGALARVVGLVIDVTERHHLEEQLLEAQKMEAIGRLAGGIAHDFNNLLTGILGYARFAISGLPEGHRARADVVEIERAGTRAATLTAQLLAYARRQIIAPRVTSLNDLVSGIEVLVQRLIGEDIVLVIDLVADLWSARVDPGQFEQVILNLAVNARDAMPMGGRLILETRNLVLDPAEGSAHPEVTPGSYAMLAVTDTGMGMDPETQVRIFEPFFTTKEQGKGTGLGLSVCYGVIAQAGGHILVSSEVGKGTTFRVLVPRALTDTPVTETHESVIKPAPKGDETILVVEDEPVVRKLTVRALSEQGYRVLEAGDGKAAIKVARLFPGEIHLLVADVVMPGMNGKEIATALSATRPGLRVVYMSGYAEHAVVRHGVIEDGIAFLAKPFDPWLLARIVRAVLDDELPKETSLLAEDSD